CAREEYGGGFAYW
nr:immunoglobulin heavy chain junction region [Mus musculus]MBK4198083.1 immunoglobulin heavy chain junction region [Mus musculus]MBK4198084.1 immunoglobulin heavy chain junction region [Mus musculus]MBK4198085.1 immunoglobulin heavy chain junction region [Mus musculus]